MWGFATFLYVLESLKSRRVVVTGSTGELGRGVAVALLECGAVCHLPVRSAASLDPQLKQAHVTEGVDLGDEARVSRFYDEVPELWASIHCAGGFAFTPIATASVEDLERMLAINARTAFLCSREAARRMRGGGRIVNVIARQALDPRRGAQMIPYAMSKAAVAALTVALSEELVANGILVNAVAPSIIDTPANRAAMPKEDFTRWVKVPDLAETILAFAAPSCHASGTLAPVYGQA
jgi:NAD(P)-dependent dehydrogenase (short-subunit alcohol dehydrogenase family)